MDAAQPEKSSLTTDVSTQIFTNVIFEIGSELLEILEVMANYMFLKNETI